MNDLLPFLVGPYDWLRPMGLELWWGYFTPTPLVLLLSKRFRLVTGCELSAIA